MCDRQFQPGFAHWGSFAEFVAIDHAQVNLIRILSEAPTTLVGKAVAYYAARRLQESDLFFVLLSGRS